jgi:hypothetical protein
MMDAGILTLRILHIGFGTFWVGTDLFFTFLLMPRLRALGPHIERPVLAAAGKALGPVLMVSSIITFASGLMLVGAMRGWNVSWLFASGWGIAIFAGFVGTAIALFVGFGLVPPVVIRLDRLTTDLEGRAPTAAEATEVDALRARGATLGRVNSLLLIVVVISMAVARFV